MLPLSGKKWRTRTETASCVKIDFAEVLNKIDREFLTLDDMRHLAEALCLRMDTAKPPLDHIRKAFPLHPDMSKNPSSDVDEKYQSSERTEFASGTGIPRRSNYLGATESPQKKERNTFLENLSQNALDESTEVSLFTDHPNKNSSAYKMASHARAEGYFALSELILSQERTQWRNAAGRFYQVPGLHEYNAEADNFLMGFPEVWTWIKHRFMDVKARLRLAGKMGTFLVI